MVRKLGWFEFSWDSYGEYSCLIIVKLIVKIEVKEFVYNFVSRGE